MSGRGVFVVGMHRSGTSAAARFVNLLGVPLLGDDLLPADDVNPRGYWESASLLRANDELLGALGGSWSHPPAPPDWTRANGLEPRLREALGPRLAAEWVWKDPRVSVTLPFWLEALRVQPAVVLVYRDPREVAASLARRDGFGERRALALWERYVRAALAGARGLPTVVAGYAELLGDPEGWAARVAAFLAARGFSVVPPERGTVRSFVDPGLRRSRAEAGPFTAGPSASAEQVALWETLERLRGEHEALPAVPLGPETPWVEDELLAGELAGLRARVGSLEAALADVLGSRSYRWSAPARRAAGTALRLARGR